MGGWVGGWVDLALDLPTQNSDRGEEGVEPVDDLLVCIEYRWVGRWVGESTRSSTNPSHPPTHLPPALPSLPTWPVSRCCSTRAGRSGWVGGWVGG